jgi:hypothetical protein
MSVLKSALQSGIRLNAGRRNSRLSLYLIAASLVILVLLANIVHFERRGQHQPRPRTCDAKDIVLGISIPNANRKFQSLGGTKHWFHLVERLIINIDRMIELHKTVESMKGRSSKTIYIIFDRKYDVENLGPFGRLLFVSLVFGREIASDEALFERIIFGYSSLKTVIHHSGTMLVEAHQFHPHHIVDIKSRGITAVKSKCFTDVLNFFCTDAHFLHVGAFQNMNTEMSDFVLPSFLQMLTTCSSKALTVDQRLFR